MWHIEPDSRIAVSIKRNPGMTTHEQCGANGYINIKPSLSVAQPQLNANQLRSLQADLRDRTLTVSADGTVVWQANLADEVMDFNGPVGLRTDNARFEFEFLAAPRARANEGGAPPNHCAPTPGN
jgi:hypothetical protein